MANHGTAFASRFELMRERIEAMKAIWTQDVAEYHGKFVELEAMWCWPKPVQKPYPPILLGGRFPHNARRAIAYGDGWMPIAERPPTILDAQPRFRQMAAAAGRDPGSLDLTAFLAPRDGERLRRYADAGITRAVFEIMPEPADRALAELDRLARLVAEVGGQKNAGD
jgi:alkanesulfonate monooxygenase SsuD/methylene tetrahydromethanopterin reductase-like flavin-dependent oxidoreductase (luciferase family)